MNEQQSIRLTASQPVWRLGKFIRCKTDSVWLCLSWPSRSHASRTGALYDCLSTVTVTITHHPDGKTGLIPSHSKLLLSCPLPDTSIPRTRDKTHLVFKHPPVLHSSIFHLRGSSGTCNHSICRPSTPSLQPYGPLSSIFRGPTPDFNQGYWKSNTPDTSVLSGDA